MKTDKTPVSPTEPTECETLPVHQAAKILGIGRSTAYQAAERGEIPAIRIGGRWLVLKEKLYRLLAGEKV